jgi:hypothetical protein
LPAGPAAAMASIFLIAALLTSNICCAHGPELLGPTESASAILLNAKRSRMIITRPRVLTNILASAGNVFPRLSCRQPSRGRHITRPCSAAMSDEWLTSEEAAPRPGVTPKTKRPPDDSVRLDV